ncbi:MAG: hypothetical protein K0U98_07905 [Deltaproteobacteria bacterium]|nr:hypothetical protein [Deltaproteobacteria bacterium]
MIRFPGTTGTPVEKVGGKGHALIRMTEAGLAVPPGAVLTTDFFAPWFDEILSSSLWQELLGEEGKVSRPHCQALQGICSDLPLNADQNEAVEELRRLWIGEGTLCAVRSSSPQEDSASASFAGGYETRLGVPLADLEVALRTCFASCFDERVMVYRQQQGLDIQSSSFAAVVQQQIDSEVSGVGFSVNPLTNDYDEAVINASWGLGESVVAGQVSPDHFIVDKVRREILEESIGRKQTSVWLLAEGGTEERGPQKPLEPSLTSIQVLEVTELICRVEALYDCPMDIEWAYGEGGLYLLQARPITTYVPLPEALKTEPGERRTLYVDSALSKGMTTNSPISPMELDWMKGLASTFFRDTFRTGVTPEDGLVLFEGARMYLNFSNVLWLASPQQLSKGTAPQDISMGEILANVDADRYRAKHRPPWLRLKSLTGMPRLLWRMRSLFGHILWALIAPRRAHGAFQRRAEVYERAMGQEVDDSLSLTQFLQVYGDRMVGQAFSAMSVFAAAMMSLEALRLVVGKKLPHHQALIQSLQVGFEGDVVVEMGIEMVCLAKLLTRADFDDLDELAHRIEARELSPEFLSAWDAFLVRFGARGPLEMDVASPRYGDDPRLALRQMSFMNTDDGGFDPSEQHRKQVERRFQAYEELLSRLGWPRRSLLRRAHLVIDLFAGTRDTPKHHLVLFHYAFRKRLLLEGKRLVRQGRLDSPEEIFHLKLTDLESAARDPYLDLRALSEENSRFGRILDHQVSEFPQVIDSRGRILRPAPRPETPGELHGLGVSRGSVKGPIKVLRNPHEKTVEEGDVLVAYTTDPGWTPLFVNAAAVILEVGGVLQHGAVVAREYGKPCVVGIDRLMNRVQDGQWVEVDGGEGVVRLLESPDAKNGDQAGPD